MHNNSVFSPRSLFFLLFTVLTFSAGARAQAIEPDQQIVRQMIAYLGKVEAAFSPTTIFPKNSRESKTVSAAARRNQPVEENARESSALFALERRAFDIINQQRAAKRLPLLKWNENMARVARLHSGNMARYKFFSHTGRDGSMVSDRAKSLVSRTWYSIGENIAFNKGFGKPVEMACQHWMTSPGHRSNILDPYWKESGIGAAFAPDGSFYLTQVFIY